ncbi:MAG TPA: hypothetical protein VL460_00430 [Caulobacteraceae bacterium]|jgi:hypothetical protein|nr:hypothetical protein [Caulobacteraceae bacterium]
MRKPAKPVLLGLIAVAVLSVAGYGWGADDIKDRPKTLTHEAEIKSLLEHAGWVSPGLSKTKVLYMVSWQACPPCIVYEREDFPKLHAAGVDTRVIMYARASSSTPQERAGVAELWKNRSWATWKRFTAIPTSSWTAEGLPADTVPERAALVKKSQAFADKMRGLMADNGIGTREHLNLPTLIWYGKDGHLRGCGCEKVETRKYVLQELGAA